MKHCFLILLFSFSNQVFAENYLTLLGGGGEPKSKPNTIFDSSLAPLNEFVKANKGKWNYGIYYNGGHSETEAALQSQFADATVKKPFEKDSKADVKTDSLKETVATYLKDIESGKIKSNDQIVIMINTHGGQKTDASKTHLITAGAADKEIDRRNLSGATGLINMDVLFELRKAANEKGIKLGIIDFSCQSGNSMSLANDQTCVIAATGPEHFSFPPFAKEFFSNMKSGKSLEDVFLQTRAEDKYNSYPMISSPQGRLAHEKLYAAISPFMLYDATPEVGGKELSAYIERSASRPEICDHDKNFKTFEKQITEIKAVLAAESDAAIAEEINKLHELVKKQNDRITEKIKIAKSLGAREFLAGEIHTFEARGTFKNKSETAKHSFSLPEIVEANFDKLIKAQEDAATDAITDQITFRKDTKDMDLQIAAYNASAELNRKAKVKQQELLEKFPHLKNYRERFKAQMADLEKDSYADVGKIAAQERKIYDLLYRKKDADKTKQNPCADIVM